MSGLVLPAFCPPCSCSMLAALGMLLVSKFFHGGTHFHIPLPGIGHCVWPVYWISPVFINFNSFKELLSEEWAGKMETELSFSCIISPVLSLVFNGYFNKIDHEFFIKFSYLLSWYDLQKFLWRNYICLSLFYICLSHSGRQSGSSGHIIM